MRRRKKKEEEQYKRSKSQKIPKIFLIIINWTTIQSWKQVFIKVTTGVIQKRPEITFQWYSGVKESTDVIAAVSFQIVSGIKSEIRDN